MQKAHEPDSINEQETAAKTVIEQNGDPRADDLVNESTASEVIENIAVIVVKKMVNKSVN